MRHVLVALIALLALPTAGRAQVAGAQAETVNVFLDCQAQGCDSQHFRNEIAFVSWVRDRTVADVHLLITAQGAGGGSTAYEITYMGQRAFADDSVTLPLTVPQAATEPERRDMLTRRIAQGLVHYAARTSVADRIRLDFEEEDEARPAQGVPVDDPWNLWVFSVGLDVSTEGESRELTRDANLSFDARRVSADWKFEFEIEGEYEEERFELTDRTASRVTRNYNSDAMVVRALAPLWSAGFGFEVGSSTFRNQDLFARAAAVLEYSFFPYEQFSRRQVTLQYSVGTRYFDYSRTTIYDQLEEQRFDHELELSVEYQQPWGEAFASLSGSHYLHDINRANLSLHTGIDVRLFRGFSLDVFASYSAVHDQLYIAKGDDDDEDVLLRRRELETNYQYDLSVGISYTFGSIYNNIVNPRLNQGGGNQRR